MLKNLIRALQSSKVMSYSRTGVNQIDHQQKLLVILSWITRFGYTTPSIIEELLNANNKRGLHSQFVKAGILEERNVYRKNFTKIIGLTKRGAIMARKLLSTKFVHVNINRLSHNNLEHDVRVQTVLLSLIEIYDLNSFIAGDAAKSFSAKHDFPKAPDLIVQFRSAHILFVEVEICGKAGMQFDLFWQAVYEMTSDYPEIGFSIVVESEMLFQRYIKKIFWGKRIKIHEINKWGKRVHVENAPVTKKFRRAVYVTTLVNGRMPNRFALPSLLLTPRSFDENYKDSELYGIGPMRTEGLCFNQRKGRCERECKC